ncbi:MAG TPA: glycosyltransferase family 4 protein [Actinomycetota bacterium]|nr:glycosyltransferase family 4 protein [Actinomycetota bacterium]
MRVVHVIRSDGFAGVERHVAVLARAQAANGDDVVIIGGDRDRMTATLPDGSVELRSGNTVAEALRSLQSAAADADLLHAHMTAAEFVAAMVGSVGRARRLPLIATRHFAARRGSSVPGRASAALIASRLTAQISISRFVADRIDGTSEVVYPGVEAIDAPAPTRGRTVLVVQRLEPEKRTDVAIRAFAASGLADDGWRLKVAGHGSLLVELERLTEELGISARVDFLGPRRDVAELMSRSAILLAPCPIEGLGLVVLEAMAAQLPVVASAAGGHLETLPAQAHAFCFEANDANAASRSLVRLAGDSALRARLAAAGLSRQREFFTPAAQAIATEKVYRAALAGRTMGQRPEGER